MKKCLINNCIIAVSGIIHAPGVRARIKPAVRFAAVLTMSAVMIASSAASIQAAQEPLQQTAADDAAKSTSGWPAAPDISAGSAILMDADTGAILYDKDCHSKAYPASTTKIMTALLAIENRQLDEVITFSKAAANSYKWDEANTGTREGEQFTLEQALYAILLKSANEVAYGIGEFVGGSIPSFTAMMNTRAQELGALNTHFNNPNGLSDPEHYTTAYDLAMIGRACFNNSIFMTIDAADSYKIGSTNKTAETRYFQQRHGLAPGNNYQYEYYKGGKTGFTDESGYTLITFAQKDDMRLICVVFREADDASRYIDTKALFDYGFNNFKKTAVSGNDVSSLFNSASYYNSGIFSSPGLTFSMDSSFADLPSEVSMSDVSIDVPDSAMTDDAHDFSTNIIFNYDGHIVGKTMLTVTAGKNGAASGNLPYVKADNASEYAPKKCIVINVRYAIICIVAILILFEIFESILESRLRRQRRRRMRRRRR